MQKALIIGTGFMGGAHARAVRSAGHLVSGFVGTSQSKAEALADNFPGAAAFDNVVQALRATKPDVVHVCTPNFLHVEHSLHAIDFGANVICEKPIATNLDDAERLLGSTNENGVIGVVPFVYRFYAAVQEIRHRVATNEAGDLHLLHGSYLQDWLADSEETNWRVDSDKGGSSRAFADIGVHWCDLVEHISGHQITRVVATASKAHGQRQGREVNTEDAVSVVFETNRGARGSLVVSQVSLGRKNRIWIEIDGEDASFTFDHDAPNTVLIGGLTTSTLLDAGFENLEGPDARRLRTIPSGHPQGYLDAFTSLMSTAYRSFESGVVDPMLPTFADGLRAVRLTEAVMQSAQSGDWVELEGNFSVPRNSVLGTV